MRFEPFFNPRQGDRIMSTREEAIAACQRCIRALYEENNHIKQVA